MIRQLPVDTARLELVSTGHVTPVAEWAELADGSRRPIPGGQAKNDYGRPLWVVDAIPVDEERGEVVGIQVASEDEPQVEQFKPVQFDGLQVRMSVGRNDGKLKLYWSADGLINHSRRPLPSPQPAGTSA
jgi:hypothetical protein